MKNLWKKAWKELRKNRGSGVLLVMVAITSITLMTTSLLHLTYTGFKMKAAEQQNKIDFYMADAKMDELKSGVENIVSAAISDAQKVTLSDYITTQPEATASTAAPPEASTEFPSVDGETTTATEENSSETTTATEGSSSETTTATEGSSSETTTATEGSSSETTTATEGSSSETTTATEESSSETTEATTEATEATTETEIIVGTIDGNNTLVFQDAFLDALENRLAKTEGIYDVDVLKNMFHSTDNSIVIANDSDCKYTKDEENRQFILHNVRMTYRSEKSGSTTSIKMDIVISVPDFLYIEAGKGATNDTTELNVSDLVKFKNWATY